MQIANLWGVVKDPGGNQDCAGASGLRTEARGQAGRWCCSTLPPSLVLTLRQCGQRTSQFQRPESPSHVLEDPPRSTALIAMDGDRSSAQRKFLRGVEQVRQLLAEAEAFQRRDAYVFRTEVEWIGAQRSPITAMRVSRKRHRKSGHCWQAKRSRICALAGSHGLCGIGWAGLDAVPDLHRVLTSIGRRQDRLAGVPDSIRATIEKAQPYQRYAPNPGQTTLEQLRLLSNLDKHRTLATVASAVEHEGVGLSRR